MPTDPHEHLTTEEPARWARRSLPALALAVVAGAAVVAVVATAVAVRTEGRSDDEGPASASSAAPTGPTSASSHPADPPPDAFPVTDVPVVVGTTLFVGGERAPGEWYLAEGRGTHWLGLRDDGTWWWGNDAEPQRMEGEVDQGPAISASGRYLAYVLTGPDATWTLVAVDTDDGELGRVELPHQRMDPAPRAVAVTDDGLVVAGGPRFQWVWRPLVDGGIVDLAETAPGEVVIGSTDAGLVVNEGRYDRTDGQLGEPYLARIDADGTLTRWGPLPNHDALAASVEWAAYAPAGTMGGEVPGAQEFRVQRLDGSGQGVLTPPDGWLFAPALELQWETPRQLVAALVPRGGGDEALARCRPDRMTCALVDLPD